MSGRETPGDVISDKSGNLYSAITGEPIAAPGTAKEAAPAWAKPAPTGTTSNSEKLPPAVGSGDGDALDAIDAEDQALYRKMMADGHFKPDEVQRLYNLTDAEMTALQAPPVPKLSITRELERIATLRRTDRRAYDRDYALQARELALLEQQAQSAAKASNEPGDASAMPAETLASWRESGGVEFHLRTAQETASVAFSALAEDERVEFAGSFDALPVSVQSGIYTAIGSEPGFTKPATNEAVSNFAGLGEAHAELAASWGSEAPQQLGRAQARINSILKSLTPSDQQAASDWFDSVPEAQAAAIIRGLAGKTR